MMVQRKHAAIASLTAALLWPALAQTPRDLKVRNTYRYLERGRYQWTLFIDEDRATLKRIRCVEYTLHPTFPDPVRRICEPEDAFRLSTDGWGEFTILLKIEWGDGRVTRQQYRLDLHSPPGVAFTKPPAAEPGPIRTGNWSRPLGNGQWEWTVFIAADASTLDQIRCVEYLLHPTFPNPIRRVCERGDRPDQAFPLSAQGWGAFDVSIKVDFREGRTRFMKHTLQFGARPPTAR